MHERGLGLGAGEATPCTRPPALGEFDAPLTGGAAHGIELPSQARSDPVHVTGHARTPGHERVVRVGDDMGVGRRGQCGAPAACHHANFVRAVELVPRQVQQHDSDGRGRRQHPREVDLVDLEDDPRRARPDESGDMTRRHVRPRLVAHHRVTGGSKGNRQQARGGRLSVRPGDERNLSSRAQVLEELRVEAEPGPAPGNGALAAPPGGAMPC